METITIGAWTVTLNGNSYCVAKNGENVKAGAIHDIVKKYASCFDKKWRPAYTIASVCLEDAIQAMARKGLA